MRHPLLLPGELAIKNKNKAQELLVMHGIKDTAGPPLAKSNLKLLMYQEEPVRRSIMDEIAEMRATFLKTQQDLADMLVHLETTTRADPGEALQDRIPIAALEREVSVQKPSEVQQAVQVPMPTGPDSFEQAFKEAQQRDARKAQLCISNLSFAEESTDTFQVLIEDFFRSEMQVNTADSQVSAVKRFTGKDGRPGILIVSCRSV